MTTPPNKVERHLYLKTNRALVYSFTLFSSGLLIFGNIAFIYMHPWLWPYAVFVLLLSLYLIITITVGLSAKDFDFKFFNQIVNAYWQQADKQNVDVFLPVCGESIEVIKNTWAHVAAMAAFHDGSCLIHVLDDGKSDDVRLLAEQFKFNYIRRAGNALKKAGNLRYAFQKTSADFIAIFDADFCPAKDFLSITIAHMLYDPKIAIVQTPQFFRDDDQAGPVARGASQIQEFFYRLVQSSRDYHNAAICVGTNALYRRESLKPFGGTAPITHSEDVHTGFECLRAGWKVKYIPVNLASGLCPETWGGFFTQQYRWAMGSLTLCFSKKFWQTRLTFWQRLSYMSGFFYYTSTGLGVVAYPIPTIYMLVYLPGSIYWWNLLFSVPSFVFSTIFMKLWMKQPYTIHLLETRHVSAWSHLFAITDWAFGTIEPWQATGGRSKSSRYHAFVCLYSLHILLIPAFVFASVGYHMAHGLLWYNFSLVVAISIFNLYVGIGPILHIYAGRKHAI
jgi:cellulose synthase/poly-beta-1,6-N-acetylglucosamine synthase-like glycosyltransferase